MDYFPACDKDLIGNPETFLGLDIPAERYTHVAPWLKTNPTQHNTTTHWIRDNVVDTRPIPPRTARRLTCRYKFRGRRSPCRFQSCSHWKVMSLASIVHNALSLSFYQCHACLEASVG